MSKRIDHNREAVIAKYKEYGWTLLATKGINDFIANHPKNNKYHFIQVIHAGNDTDAKFSELARNSFIQNAFSNNALPVYAHCKQTRNGIVVTCEDINTGATVIFRKTPLPSVDKPPVTQPVKPRVTKHNVDKHTVVDNPQSTDQIPPFEL